MKNGPVGGASISVKGSSTMIVADSSGYFTIDANKNDTLLVTADGFDPAFVTIPGKDMVVVRLAKDNNNNVNNTDIIRQQAIGNAFTDFAKGQTGNLYNGSALPMYHGTEETMGSRYYYPQWQQGDVYHLNGALLSDNSLWLNYDKMSRSLLVSKDRKMMIEANADSIDHFVFRDEDNIETLFTKIPAINKRDFFIHLTGTRGKYELYKSVKTVFEKANYVSDGMTESGHNYDLYMDEYHYYVYFPHEKKYKMVDLKKKILESVFASDQRVHNYLSRENYNIDEAYLIRMINELNQ